MPTPTKSSPTHPEILKTDTRGRVRVDAGRRAAILAEFDRSAMSGAAFARRHGIKYTTFNYWLKARREAAREPRGLELVEIAVAGRPARDPAGDLRVVLPGGARLEVRDEASARLAAALLRALEPGGE